MADVRAEAGVAVTERFNTEQQVMLGVLRWNGCPDPESVLEEERMLATALGAALLPTLQDLAAKLDELLTIAKDDA